MSPDEQKILVINTGNTSTKIGLFNGGTPLFVETIRHSDADLAPFEDINQQKDFRERMVREFLTERAIDTAALTAVAARGGLLKPLASGTYRVNGDMIDDLIEARRGLHASHLSAQIGFSIAREAGIPCYVVDPVSVDEFDEIARYTGHRRFERVMLSHALNMKAVAKRYAREKNRTYESLRLIVVHLGTGISISVHSGGRMIDAVNPSEEGPFALDRTGGLPILQLARYIIESETSFPQVSRMVFSEGGVFSYLGTTDFREVERRIQDGDRQAAEVVEAMGYQVAKEIGALATVVRGEVEAILLTGGMAHAAFFVEMISDRVSFIAPVSLYPGEDEMAALAEGVHRVLCGDENEKRY